LSELAGLVAHPATYDVVAAEYAAKFSNELDDKPFDRELLDDLAREVAGRGLVCDLGCGPGQIGAYLAHRGCDVMGIDISPGMLQSARQRHGDMRFQPSTAAPVSCTRMAGSVTR
jgi:trans-aconitate methyltransferase